MQYIGPGRDGAGLEVKYLFPSIVIAMMLGASAVAFGCGDYRRGTYWLAGAILNVAATF
jgi:hypothetical protein